ncbi:MAG: hypothetical protein HUJ26_07255 [Planctomycetaceae bacterium]|nr:hypothetical protein [Planctomycetaceae bacterium]
MFVAGVGFFLDKDFFEDFSALNILFYVSWSVFWSDGLEKARVDPQKKKNMEIGCLLWSAIFWGIALVMFWAGFLSDENPQTSPENGGEVTESLESGE